MAARRRACWREKNSRLLQGRFRGDVFCHSRAWRICAGRGDSCFSGPASVGCEWQVHSGAQPGRRRVCPCPDHVIVRDLDCTSSVSPANRVARIHAAKHPPTYHALPAEPSTLRGRNHAPATRAVCVNPHARQSCFKGFAGAQQCLYPDRQPRSHRARKARGSNAGTNSQYCS